tara:strand:- start:348 stop:503 length:156 start_codon:yes stop_codon:yes gene_type:complete
MEKNAEKKPTVNSGGMVDLLLNILENSKSSKEDKGLARGELKRLIESNQAQ